MKVHLINTYLITEYMERHKDSSKSLSAWLTIMNHTDWSAVADINETFGFTSRQGRDVTLYVSTASVIIVCRYHFLVNRVHLIIRKIEIHEVQGNQVERAVR